jgi:serine protease Do
MRGLKASLTAFGILSLGGLASAQNLSPDLYEAMIKASPQLYCVDARGKVLSSGSGTFLSREGIILTNNHVVTMDDNQNQECAKMGVLMVKNEDQPPELRYIARIVSRIKSVDLALVQITTDLQGRAIPAGTRFPAVPLGDSDRMRIGETIFVFGYPGVSGNTITVTGGTVNGFLDNRSYVKISANSGRGGSGGAIVNLKGELVSVLSAGNTRDDGDRQVLGRPLALGMNMIRQNVRTYGESWDVQFRNGTSNIVPVNTSNPPPALPGGTVSGPPALPGSSSGSGNTPPPLPTNNASSSAPVWPPKPAQTWLVSIDGLSPWTLEFTGVDEDNDPVGTATQNGQRSKTFAFRIQDTGTYRFQMVAADGSGSYFCDFAQLRTSGNAFIDGAAGRSTRDQNNNSKFQSLSKACTAALGSSSASVSSSPTQPPGLPSAGPVAVFPPKVGQLWRVTIDGLAPWDITFTGLDKDGDPQGRAVQSGVSRAAIAYINDGDATFGMSGADGAYYCIYNGTPRVQGSSLGSAQAYFEAKGTEGLKRMDKGCNAAIVKASSTLAVITNDWFALKLPPMNR